MVHRPASLSVGESSPLLTRAPVSSPQQQGESEQQLQHHHGSASFTQTVINEAKTCMGTGCLALPYAAKVGGIWLHVLGIFAIGLWNLYAVSRLCDCLHLLAPKEQEEDNELDVLADENNEEITSQNFPTNYQEDNALEMATSPKSCHHRPTSSDQHVQSQSSLAAAKGLPSAVAGNNHTALQKSTTTYSAPPPQGTSTYSRVAWYAFGPVGLWALDFMMVTLFIGVVVAFVDATRGFLRDTPLTTGSDILDAIAIALIIGPMSAVPDMGYLAKASATGLGVLFVTFAVIAAYGVMEHEIAVAYGDDNIASWNWYPENGVEGVSTWFGCLVFGYGIAPLAYNFRDAMAEPERVVHASSVALTVVATSYVIVGVGLYALFPNIDGDVLHMLPATGWLPVLIRLSMAVVVFATAPLLVVPCGQLIEGKIVKISATSDREVPYKIRATVRIGIALTCVFISVLVPGFVSVLSLVGCASVATVGFVVPPLLFLRLRLMRPHQWSWDLTLDVIMLLWGAAATGISTHFTFLNVIGSKV